MNACDILVKLDDEILTDESKWTKGIYEDATGRVCLIGGLRKAAGVDGLSLPEVYYEAAQILGQVIKPRNRNPLIEGQTNLALFNDAHTFTEIKAVIQEARRRACEASA